MKLSQLPTLDLAFRLMVCDNVASHKIILDISARMKNFDLEIDEATLTSAEAELSKLSEEDLDHVCCGDQDDAPTVSAEVETVLTYLFENISIF